MRPKIVGEKSIIEGVRQLINKNIMQFSGFYDVVVFVFFFLIWNL